MIETPNWNMDKFGVAQPSGQQYLGKRESEAFTPIENELLSGYCRRLLALIQKQETVNTQAHIYGRKTWFTHKTPSTCWLCDDINVMWMMYEVLNLTALANPKLIFKRENNKLILQ